VAFTAHGDGPEVERARQLGCDAVIGKPVTIERLGAALAPLLGAAAQARSDGAAPQISALVADLVPRFVELCLEECAALRRAHAAGDWTAVGNIGHMLRGAGGGYGFDEVTRLGQAIEAAAKARDAAGLPTLASSLEDYLARAALALEDQRRPAARR
jgi:HPt (histidine-containing phosphotransfer) domain-containing protein